MEQHIPPHTKSLTSDIRLQTPQRVGSQEKNEEKAHTEQQFMKSQFFFNCVPFHILCKTNHSYNMIQTANLFLEHQHFLLFLHLIYLPS